MPEEDLDTGKRPIRSQLEPADLLLGGERHRTERSSPAELRQALA